MTNWTSQLLATREMPAYAETVHTYPSVEGVHGRVESLRIHPIKSLGRPLRMQSALITRKGMATEDGAFEDRQAMLGRRQNKASKPHVTHRLLSQRNFGKLCTLALKHEGGAVVYRDLESRVPAFRLETSHIRPRSGKTTIVEMHGKEYPCVVEGDDGPVTGFVRRFLRSHGCDYADEIDVLLQPIEFNRVAADHHRAEEEGALGYSDGGQLLLGNFKTVEWLNDLLEGAGKRPTILGAFRPNIGVTLPPNAEDRIQELVITSRDTEARFKAGLISVRCTMVDLTMEGETPDTAINDMLRICRPFRPTDPPIVSGKPNASTTFGLNMVATKETIGTVIRVGDKCTIRVEKQ